LASRRYIMRTSPLSAALLGAILVAGCSQDGMRPVVGPASPSMDVATGESWVITTYYWDGGWIRQTTLDEIGRAHV
jgi:hypothetical protein